MEDERLIALVEARSELFNKRSPFYKLQSRKDALWAEIGRELNASGEMCRRRWLTLRDRYGREVRKANAPSGSGMEVQRQWHLLDAMKFIQPHIVPRPIRFSQNICEIEQRQLPIATKDSGLQPHVHVQEVEVPSPLWPKPLIVSLPSPSPPVAVVPSPPVAVPPSPPVAVVPSPPVAVPPSPTASSSTSLPSPSCSTQVATQKGRKRGQSEPTNSEVDKKMMEAIDIFKNRWSTQAIMPVQQQQQSTSPAVQSFSTLTVSILNKMDEAKQVRAIEKMLEAAFAVQRGE
ncbi:leiomodin-2-like [Bactrocera dorsalis]|uniref:Leiomodin-2-like n=1 Tax=Bactrocera dorsalis TaxID=27457 RepID=A0ABM3K5F5_BACDO|nr:leiomodin-2-like [Bactrocera dorsalis]